MISYNIIKEYVQDKEVWWINYWIDEIKKDWLEHIENKILDCAEKLDKININHNANFKDCISL